MHDDGVRAAIRTAALNRYQTIDRIWSEDDRWHLHTRDRIEAFVRQMAASLRLPRDARILNIGSAGEDYGLMPANQVHLDITDRFIKQKAQYVVADAESLPFDDHSFDAVVCVGSVLNYCSALEAIREINRVMVPDGPAILEFESSTSLEFAGTDTYNQDASVVETFYQEHEERIWVYSSAYMRRVLSSTGLHVQRQQRIHVLSAILLRVGLKPSYAALFDWTDGFAAHVPWLGSHGCNIILSCRTSSPA